MSQATARTAVYNAVNGVTDSGVVYDKWRWSADWGTFLNHFKTTVGGVSQIRGWMVTYRGFSPETPPRTFAKARQRAHRFQIGGVMGVDDSADSEKTFAALAENVADAIDSDSTLHGDSFLETNDAEIATFEERVFGGTLCHYAEINVTVSEMHVPS